MQNQTISQMPLLLKIGLANGNSVGASGRTPLQSAGFTSHASPFHIKEHIREIVSQYQAPNQHFKHRLLWYPFYHEQTNNTHHPRSIPRACCARYGYITGIAAPSRARRRTGDAADLHAGGCRRVRAAGHARAEIRRRCRLCAHSRLRGYRTACGRTRGGVPRRHYRILVDDARHDESRAAM